MPIQFKDVFVYDTNPAITLEEVYKLRSNFAGIFDFKFDSLVDDSLDDLSDWSDNRGVWVADGTAVGTATATGVSWDYGELWHDEDTPSSFKIFAYLNENAVDGSCILFRGNGTTQYYLLEINQDDCGFYHYNDGTITTLSKMDPYDIDLTGPGEVELAVWQQEYSEYALDRYLFMSFRFNDRLVLSAKHNLVGGVPDLKWGLGASVGGIGRWDAVRIPDLSQIIVWSSLDPGETPMSSIERAIGDRVVTHFVRGSGELRAFKPKATSVTYTVPSTQQLKEETEEWDSREALSHVRVNYASGAVEAFDEDMLEQYGHRFQEFYNADIYHETEAYEEALAILRRSKEQMRRYTVALRNVGWLLETDDHVLLPSGDHILVDGLQIIVGEAIRTAVQGRKYAYT